ncbi:MAG: hypothetical protein ACUVRD_09375, partial [Bacteroidia bacterium]
AAKKFTKYSSQKSPPATPKATQSPLQKVRKIFWTNFLLTQTKLKKDTSSLFQAFYLRGKNFSSP